MQKFSLYCIAAAAVLFMTGVVGCKKVNGTDNGSVVETPYSLYYSDTAGALYNSTDGKTVNKLVFPPDGFPGTSICVANNNILWTKTNLYISQNNGVNFNHTYDSLNTFIDIACNGFYIDSCRSMVLYSTPWTRTYTLSKATPGDGHLDNYLGIAYSDRDGVRGTWTLDAYYDTDRVGVLPVRTSSMTQLVNGVFCAIAADPLSGATRDFYKSDRDARWKECTANPGNLPNLPPWTDTSAHTRLPSAAGATAAHFILGHLNNRLIAIDRNCYNGAYFSDDTGKNWKPCIGLPANVPLLSICSPFESTCLIGTQSDGLYMYNANIDRFELNTNGLGTNLKVRSITYKQNIYKNNTLQQYVYLATDQGIYQSTDGGHNWIKTIQGNFVAIY